MWYVCSSLYLHVLTAGLYHKLHGVPRPVAMKKTVIKRRKRVPAVGAQAGTTTRAGSTAATPERTSPANPTVAMPPTPASAQSQPSPSLFDRSGFPTAARQPTTAMADPLSLRRDPSLNRTVPLNITPSGERKKPWWVEDRRETPKSREEIEREAANAQARHTGGREHREREGVSRCFFFLHQFRALSGISLQSSSSPQI